MLCEDIEYCRQRIAEEERAAETAPSWETGCVHQQLAMLYKVELAMLLRNAASKENFAA
jgi:hypothetical protein